MTTIYIKSIESDHVISFTGGEESVPVGYEVVPEPRSEDAVAEAPSRPAKAAKTAPQAE